ncbi:MAG TPA: preprotein translocase subunit SecG [Archangium sp.]|jgi:preprotein translocase subunit SecG|uniref:preprotein translocase subunit SecG n=1 Tax=Archangium sp. TaxID=1872627 RepID=UPI002ED95785
MLTFVTIVHVLLCVFMIFVILLQPGKDAGMGSALGGGAATSAFGGRGATTFLTKVTGICAAMFFLTSLGLSFVGMRTSVAAGAVGKPAAQQQAPAVPGAADQQGTGAPPAGQIPAANPQQEAAPAPGTGTAPAQQQQAPGAPATIEQPRPTDTPAPTPAPGQ